MLNSDLGVLRRVRAHVARAGACGACGRTSVVIFSHASLPTFSSMVAMIEAASILFVQRAPLQVSVMSTVSSHSRCTPMFSGEGPPAAAQLPAPPLCFS